MAKLFEIGYLLKISGVTAVMASLDALDGKLKVLNEAPKRFGNIGNFGKSLMKAGAATARNLAQAQQKTMALSQSGTISVENLAQAYYTSRSNMTDHATALKEVAAAMRLVTGTTADAASANAQMVETTRLLSTMDKLFAGGATAHADQLAALQTRYAMLDIGEVVNSLKYIQPLSATSGLATSQMEAIAATISMGGMHREEAGTASREVLMALLTGKGTQQFLSKTVTGGFDAIATIGKLGDSLKGLSQVQAAQALKSYGFNMRDITGIGILINRYADLKATNLDLLNSNGAAASAMATRLNAPDEQLSRLFNNLHDLGTVLGNTLIPELNELIPKIITFVQSMTALAQGHGTAIRRVLELTAGLAALSIGVGAFTFLTGGAITVISKIPELMKLWTAAQWLLNAALNANPIGIAVIAMAALAALAYEVYEHWDWLASTAKQWYNAGVNLVKNLADGMLSAVMYPVHAIEHIATRIGRFIVGHSPIPEGPLHYLNLGKQIALSLNPSPVLAAVQRLALVTAVGMPIAIGGMAGTAMASAGARSGGASAPIVINYAPQIAVSAETPADMKKAIFDALESDRYRLLNIIQREIANRDRGSF